MLLVCRHGTIQNESKQIKPGQRRSPTNCHSLCTFLVPLLAFLWLCHLCERADCFGGGGGGWQLRKAALVAEKIEGFGVETGQLNDTCTCSLLGLTLHLFHWGSPRNSHGSLERSLSCLMCGGPDPS